MRRSSKVAVTLGSLLSTDAQTQHGEVILNAEQWQAAVSAHTEAVDQRVDAHLHRRRRGERHPVEDFLFEYYSLRPGQLRRWQPGVATVLLDAQEWLDQPGFVSRPDIAAEAVAVDPRCFISGDLAHRRTGAAAIGRLLRSTSARRPVFGCFGLHEWAMVYRSEPQDVRHQNAPMRVSDGQVQSTVDGLGLRCSHYDAFRFFTPAAAPHNQVRLSREAQENNEQPGCIHAGMDLYKWAYKLRPLVPSELLLACFDHARRAREIDMRASPYDLRTWGYEPIEVETADGRRRYVEEQRALSDAATPLRAKLIALLADCGL